MAHIAAPSGAEPRAFVLLKSRRRLDLLNPDPHAWTDEDLAAGLSRTMRWTMLSNLGSPGPRASPRGCSSNGSKGTVTLTAWEAESGLVGRDAG